MALSDRSRRLAVPLAVFLVGLVALGAAAIFTFAPVPKASTSTVGGPFSLVRQDGVTVTEKDFKGAPHLVFFGFTQCPEICPTKLFQLSEVLRTLGDRGAKLKALFVTVDPERDTPDVLKQYLQSFDERIVGLTGTPAAIKDVEREYRAFARKVPLKDGDYTMEHTALVYLMDKDGGFINSFNLERSPEEAAKDLARYL